MLKILKKYKTTIFLIVLLGLVLRLVGIGHGFPFIFHPDEPALVRSATGIRFDANPAHFDWPHLHFYLNYALYFVFIKFRGLLQALNLRGTLEPIFPILWRDPLIFYYLSRAFDAFIGALTAVPVFLTGKKLFNKKVATFAALAIAVMPFHVYSSHLALIDIPMTFWGAWAIYFSALIYKKGRLKDYLLAGLFVGLSTSTKYNGAVFALPVFFAHFMRSDIKESFKKLWMPILSGITSLFAFVLGTPFAIFDYKTFFTSDTPKGALWQFTNVGGSDFPTRIRNFIEVLTTKFMFDFGPTFILIFIGFILYAVFFKRKKKIWMLILSALVALFYMAGFEKIRAHYYLAAYPFVALVVGYFLSFIKKKLPKAAFWVLTAIIFIIPLGYAIHEDVLLVREDTRVVLYDWMLKNVDEDDYLVYDTSSYKEVLLKFDDNDIDKNALRKNLVGRQGFVIISGYSEEYDGLEKVYEITSEKRRGPDVIIYAF